MTHTGPAIWAEEAGDAAHPLVVLVHGAMDRSAGMLRLSRRLDHEYRVVRYDRRGYGRSTPHGGPFDMAAQVADLVQVLAGRRAVIVGHSYGGNVALAAAQLHPHLVAGVAIYETPLSWEPWWPGTTAGASAIKAAGRPHEAAEAFMRRLLEPVAAPRAWHSSTSWPTCVSTDRGTRIAFTCPSSSGTAPPVRRTIGRE